MFVKSISLKFLSSSLAFAQPGGINAGATALQGLTSSLEAYIDPVTSVVYVIAAIVGIIGAFRVYTKWQDGKDNVMSVAGGWFGSCLFLLVANTVLRAMFV